MEELCRMEESLYSWKHADMAIDVATGEPAGCLISYDGGLYADLRQKTFAYALQRIGKEMPESGMETQAGEFYIDSLAVLPEYRGFKTGRKPVILVHNASRIKPILTSSAKSCNIYFLTLFIIPPHNPLHLQHHFTQIKRFKTALT